MAAGKLSFIRDTEIENIIQNYATPVFSAAQLNPSSIKIYIIKDENLNAFVANGQNIFINSGLLLKSGSADEIIGVIAHEVGHIAGGHLSRKRDALSKFSISNILSLALSGAATIATKRGDVGNAIFGAGQSIGQQTFLAYNRAQESAADHAALKYLELTKQSAQGLLKFMTYLAKQESLNLSGRNNYLRSHPLSNDRIISIKNHIKQSRYSRTPLSSYKLKSHSRLKAKMFAFLENPNEVLQKLSRTDESLASEYAKSIAMHRLSKTENAITILDRLIKKSPLDPYLLELKSMFLFESGKGTESLPYLNKAIALLPEAPLLRQMAAKIQLELNDPDLISTAIENLKIALLFEPKSNTTWYQLAIAYGRSGNKGMSSLALAEQNFIIKKFKDAMYHAKRAEHFLAKGSREWLQTQDIIRSIEIQKRHKRRNE